MFREWGNARANALWEGGGVGVGRDGVGGDGVGGDGNVRGDGIDLRANDDDASETSDETVGDGFSRRQARVHHGEIRASRVRLLAGWGLRMAERIGVGVRHRRRRVGDGSDCWGADVNGGGGGFRSRSPVASRRRGGGRDAVVEALLQNGADARAKDAEGRTALHACVEGHADACAKLLIRRGASVEARDVKGRTALDAATERGSVKDEELFLMLSNVQGVDVAGR